MADPTPDAGLRSRLIEAAIRMIDEQGEAAVTLRALARETGVSAMAPYRHFADKAAILGAAAEAGFAALAECLAEADRTEPAEAALVAQGLAYLRFALARPALFRLMFGGRPVCDAAPGQYGEAFAILSRRVAGIATDAQDAGTLATWGVVHGLATLAIDGKLPSAEAPVAAALRLVVRGLAPVQPVSG
ncbi:TetR/AcrR family transcriptional regulator [Sphingomonas sp. RS6]